MQVERRRVTREVVRARGDPVVGKDEFDAELAHSAISRQERGPERPFFDRERPLAGQDQGGMRFRRRDHLLEEFRGQRILGAERSGSYDREGEGAGEGGLGGVESPQLRRPQVRERADEGGRRRLPRCFRAPPGLEPRGAVVLQADA